MSSITRRQVSLTLLGIAFIVPGTLHFLIVDFYLKIMPPYLPYPLALVYLSGFFEILGGIGVFIPRLRRAAGVGLILLLVAVFPANVYMFQNELGQKGWTQRSFFLLARLPLQALLIWWVYRVTLRPEKSTS